MWKIFRRSTFAGVICALIGMLVWPAPVQTVFNAAPVAEITVNLGHDGGTTGTINTTGANLLVACVSTHGYGPMPQLTDSKGNSWTLAASSLEFQDGEMRLFYSVPASVGAGHSFTIGGSSVLASISVMAWAGAHASPFDKASGAGVAGTSIQPGSVTPAENNELLITCLTNTGDSSNSSRSINGNFTIAGQVGQSATVNYSMSIASAYLVQTAAGAANPTWTYPVNNTANAVIATFKTAAGAGGGGDLASKSLLDLDDLTVASGFKFDVWADPPDPFRIGYVSAYNPANDSLFVGGGPGGINYRIMEVDIPTLVAAGNVDDVADLNSGTILQNKYEPTGGRQSEIAADPSYFKYGGLLVHGSRLLLSAFNWYDANNNTRVSHGAHGLTLSGSTFEGWKALNDNTKTGHSSGPMAVLPDYAASAFGYPLFAASPAASIISRLSFGPSIVAFNPTAITGTSNGTIAGLPLLWYPDNHPLDYVVGQNDGDNKFAVDSSDLWTRATQITGVVVPVGYRTVLFFGTQGTGDYCYGPSTQVASEHNTPNPLNTGQPKCYDPGTNYQGEHGYPYRYQVWAYDLNHLLEVKNGTREIWNVQPYDYREMTFPLVPTDQQGKSLGAVGYDTTGKRIFMPQMGLNGVYSQSAVVWVVTHP